jgi:hypothetical protein
VKNGSGQRQLQCITLFSNSDNFFWLIPAPRATIERYLTVLPIDACFTRRSVEPLLSDLAH